MDYGRYLGFLNLYRVDLAFAARLLWLVVVEARSCSKWLYPAQADNWV
jgi:hypothetical protein